MGATRASHHEVAEAVTSLGEDAAVTITSALANHPKKTECPSAPIRGNHEDEDKDEDKEEEIQTRHLAKTRLDLPLGVVRVVMGTPGTGWNYVGFSKGWTPRKNSRPLNSRGFVCSVWGVVTLRENVLPAIVVINVAAVIIPLCVGAIGLPTPGGRAQTSPDSCLRTLDMGPFVPQCQFWLRWGG